MVNKNIGGLKMIDLKYLKNRIEDLAEAVHDAWLMQKRKGGWHSPCGKNCRYCHPDMIPYRNLTEKVKNYDRVTVKTVLNAIEKMSISKTIE